MIFYKILLCSKKCASPGRSSGSAKLPTPTHRAAADWGKQNTYKQLSQSQSSTSTSRVHWKKFSNRKEENSFPGNREEQQSETHQHCVSFTLLLLHLPSCQMLNRCRPGGKSRNRQRQGRDRPPRHHFMLLSQNSEASLFRVTRFWKSAELTYLDRIKSSKQFKTFTLSNSVTNVKLLSVLLRRFYY